MHISATYEPNDDDDTKIGHFQDNHALSGIQFFF